jgi:hypothetical protein
VSSQLQAPAALPLGKEPQAPIEYEAGWAPEPVWRTWRRENSWPYRDSNSESSFIQPVTSSYTDCAIPAPKIVSYSPQNTVSFINHVDWYTTAVCITKARHRVGTLISVPTSPRSDRLWAPPQCVLGVKPSSIYSQYIYNLWRCSFTPLIRQHRPIISYRDRFAFSLSHH